jgi:hypothetical protein
VSDEDGDLLADSYNILKRRNIYFCQLLNVHGVNDARQTEMHTAEPLILGPISYEAETAIKKLNRHKSQGFDQIPAELIQAEGNTLRY